MSVAVGDKSSDMMAESLGTSTQGEYMVSSLSIGFMNAGSGRRPWWRNLFLRLLQILQYLVDHLKTLRCAHRDQQPRVLMKAQRRRIGFTEHLPAGFDGRGNALD